MIWSNKHVFDPMLMAPLLHASPLAPVPIEEPMSAAEAAAASFDKNSCAALSAEVTVAETAAALCRYRSSRAPLVEGAVTLSGIPSAKLQAVAHLDTIKAQSRVRINIFLRGRGDDALWLHPGLLDCLRNDRE